LGKEDDGSIDQYFSWNTPIPKKENRRGSLLFVGLCSADEGV